MYIIIAVYIQSVTGDLFPIDVDVTLVGRNLHQHEHTANGRYILIPICILLLYIITVYIPVWIYTYEYISLSMDQPPAFALLWYILLLHIKHKLRIDRYFYTCMYIYVLYTYSPRSLLMPIGLFWHNRQRQGPVSPDRRVSLGFLFCFNLLIFYSFIHNKRQRHAPVSPKETH